MMNDQARAVVAKHTNPKTDWNEWDVEGLNRDIAQQLAIVPKGSVYFSEDDLKPLSSGEVADKRGAAGLRR